MGYVYRHVRLDKNEVFYIGIGLKEDDYKRAYSKDSRRSQHWRSIIKSTPYRVDIMFEDDDANVIKEKEKEFIKLYGRKDLGLGTLVNFTDGGDGMLGHVPSDEHRKAISKSQLGSLNHNYGKTTPDEVRKKISDANKGKTVSAETREKLSKAGKGRIVSEETIEKIRLANIGKCGELSPVWGRRATKEEREHLSRVRKGRPSLNKIKVIDTISGKVYESAIDAINDLKLNTSLTHVRDMIRGCSKNWTSLVYLDEYNNSDDISKLQVGNNINPNEKIVLNKVTGIFFESIKEAYDFSNLNYSFSHFTTMLAGKYLNKTPYICV